MKKRTIKSLALNKKSITDLNSINKTTGGIFNTRLFCGQNDTGCVVNTKGNCSDCGIHGGTDVQVDL